MQNLAARDTFLIDIKKAFKNISIVPYLKSRRNRIKTLFPSYDKHTYAYTFTHTSNTYSYAILFPLKVKYVCYHYCYFTLFWKN